MPNNLLKITPLLATLEAKLRQLISTRKLYSPVMIGIHSGGVLVAKKMHQRLAICEPIGIMDISFYRDDFSELEKHPNTTPSQLPIQMEGRNIILIDDVFYTGRTARAALNEVFDFGRPRQVVLAVLIEREGRQVPLRPDCSGGAIILPSNKKIKLTDSEPLDIVIQPSASHLSAA